MYLMFDELSVRGNTISVSWDGGNTYTDYNVNDVKETGIQFTDDICSDFSLIKIKGKISQVSDIQAVVSSTAVTTPTVVEPVVKEISVDSADDIPGLIPYNLGLTVYSYPGDAKTDTKVFDYDESKGTTLYTQFMAYVKSLQVPIEYADMYHGYLKEYCHLDESEIPAVINDWKVINNPKFLYTDTDEYDYIFINKTTQEVYGGTHASRTADSQLATHIEKVTGRARIRAFYYGTSNIATTTK